MAYRYRHGDRPLEGYTIQRGVGRGGFGEVYYAVSDGGRDVALKCILYNEDIELRGVRHCINLKSPHLVSVFDVRPGDGGLCFVIMEYVTGPSFRDLLRQEPAGLGADKAAYLISETAKGLSCLHERGIVHRDLKPENLFFDEGYVKIGDYGLSKFMNASHQSGQTISVGTVQYMAPEIGSENYRQGIDIYALGVILFELLTGDVPFQGSSMGEILMKHLTRTPDLTGLDPRFREIISRALEKKPEDRYPTAEAMVEGLFTDASLRTSLSSFDTSTLASAKPRDQAAEDSLPPRPPKPEAAAEPASHEKATDERQEPRWQFHLAEGLECARQQVLDATAAARNTVERIYRAPADNCSTSVPPARRTRIFWGFIAGALVALGTALVLAPLAIAQHGGDSIGAATFGVGCYVFSAFAFYRGLWARRRSFWRRSLLPFLLTSSLAGVCVSLTAFVGFQIKGWGGDEQWVALITATVSALVFLSMIGLKHWGAGDPDAEKPWHERPVSRATRSTHIVTSIVFVGGAFVAAIVGINTLSSTERVVFLCLALLGIFLALFFLRLGLRRRRGYFWSGTVRGFLFAFVYAGLAIAILPLSLGWHMTGDNLMAFIVLGSVSLGLGIVLAILGRPPGQALTGARYRQIEKVASLRSSAIIAFSALNLLAEGT